MKRLSLDEIITGMNVRYVPMHAHGNVLHPDVESGIVSSKNERFAFVKFHRQIANLGWDGITSQACRPEDLVER